MSSKDKFPCKNCKNREVGCHSFCEEYKEAKIKHDKSVAELRQAKKELNDVIDFRIRSTEKTRDRCNKRNHRYRYVNGER